MSPRHGDGLSPLFSWRSAVSSTLATKIDGKTLSSTTKHVALALSLYMSERGDSAYPGARNLVLDTGYSDRCIREHLGVLVENGWLVLLEQGGRRGERKRANVYKAVVPSRYFEAVKAAETASKVTGDPASPVTEGMATPDPPSVHHVITTPKDPPTPQGGRRRARRRDGVADDAYPADFEQFWRNYPRKIEKPKAFRAWTARLRAGVDAKTLIGAAARYHARCNRQATDLAHVKHAATFLGPDEPWRDFLPGAAADAEDTAAVKVRYDTVEPRYV